MKNKIVTILGEFVVMMSYHPAQDDDTLLKLTKCINEQALEYLQEGFKPEEVLELLDEFDLEKKLFKSVTVPRGSGPRLTLSLKKKEIEFSNF